MANGIQPPPDSPANNFVNPQTALSFPVASGGIASAWAIAGQLHAPTGASPWFPVVLSCLVGFAFYYVSDKCGATPQERIPFIVAAFFNTVILAASVLGLQRVAANAVPNPPAVIAPAPASKAGG
jgi:hypothetical protein